MPSVRDVVGEWVGRADRRALPGLYAAVSIRPERTRAWLRAAGKPFVDPARGLRPDASELARTAAWVTRQSRVRMALVGGLAGLGGVASIPPEAMASVVSASRLAQRLAVVYGFDPRTDRGQMAVWQALAAGFDVDLPQGGPLRMRVSRVPSMVLAAASQADASDATEVLATAVVRRSAWWVAGRLSRWLPLPVVSSGLGARAQDRRVAEIGERMARTLARIAEATIPEQRVVEAVEVVGG